MPAPVRAFILGVEPPRGVDHPGVRLSLAELFEVEHLDGSLARFRELRPGSSGTTPAP